MVTTVLDVGTQTTDNDDLADLAQTIPTFNGMPVALDLIDPNPMQPRADFNQAELEALAESIRAVGVIQAITVEIVYPSDEGGEIRYILHDGERRTRAARLAGLTEIPAIVFGPGADQRQLLIRATVANVQRSDLNPIELARSYQKMADLGLSDAEIAQQVGKSRPSIANTRRLVKLPDEQQQQVAKGELNERQALALLPLYQLPDKTREAVLTSWEGAKLKEPQKYTSDELRYALKNAVAGKSKLFDLSDPNKEYDGEKIYHKTCNDCPYYTKLNSQMYCVLPDCYNAKANQDKRDLLSAASRKTGLPYVEPGQNNGTYNFLGDIGNQALQNALTDHCIHLRIEYCEYSHYSSAEHVEGFDNIIYCCAGHECQCRKKLEKAAADATAKQKQAIQQVKDQGISHLAKVIADDPAGIIRTIVHHLTKYGRSYGDPAKMKPQKLVATLATILITSNANPVEYRSVETCQNDIDAYLTTMGLPTCFSQANTVQIAKFDRDLTRIAEWMSSLRYTPPTSEQLSGNLSNLAQIANDAQTIHDTGNDTDRAQLTELKINSKIDDLKTIVLILKEILSREGARERIEIKHVPWLLTVPSGDINFKSSLTEAKIVDTLRYTLALFPLFSQGKTAREAIERRMRAIEKTLLNQIETKYATTNPVGHADATLNPDGKIVLTLHPIIPDDSAQVW